MSKVKGSTYGILQRYIVQGIYVHVSGYTKKKHKQAQARLIGLNTNDGTPYPLSIGYYDVEGNRIGCEFTTADKVTPILYSIEDLRTLTDEKLGKLGENVHFGAQGIHFYSYEGDLEAELDYSGEYRLASRALDGQRIYFDLPSMPFELAVILIKMGFAVGLDDTQYIRRID